SPIGFLRDDQVGDNPWCRGTQSVGRIGVHRSGEKAGSQPVNAYGRPDVDTADGGKTAGVASGVTDIPYLRNMLTTDFDVVAAVILYGGKILCVQKGEARYDYLSHKYEFPDRKSTRLNSSHVKISYAVFC